MAEIVTVEQCLHTVKEALGNLTPDQAVEFWEQMLQIQNPSITELQRRVLRAAYRKRAVLNRAKVRTGDLFEEDAKGTLNISFEPVPFNSLGEVYLEQRPSLKEKPHEPHPEKWAGMGAVVDHFESFHLAWIRVETKFAGARIVQAVPVPLEGPFPQGLYPRHVFDPDRGPFVLHIIAVLLKGVPSNPRGRFFTREELFQLDLVSSHQHIILPAAFHWYDTVGFGVGPEVYDLTVMKGESE